MTTATVNAKDFVSKLMTLVPQFMEAVEEKLPFVTNLEADHVCWRTETTESYQGLVLALKEYRESDLLIESEIGGRPIATFEFKEGIRYKERYVKVLEIPSPKEGSPYKEGLEHVEFVIGESSDHGSYSPINDTIHKATLKKVMLDHPETNWNTKASSKEVNPDVSVKLDLSSFGTCSVKFHLLPLAKVIEYELAHGMT
ncbi:unnamed protein product [Cylindrotheca closterium]|uniref:Uncharacterized protein n=1 Tax=Cylindrotheca closterium TaxID=2856 RepID=A0AAD2FII0_9STRA|nr:unnamed protein product [Cylindrotheca closterium]